MTTPLRINHRLGVLRFFVLFDAESITVYLSQAAWQSQHGGSDSEDCLLQIYNQHQTAIDAAVIRRAQADDRRPLVLRTSDFASAIARRDV
jgi:hypothetical protein